MVLSKNLKYQHTTITSYVELQHLIEEHLRKKLFIALYIPTVEEIINLN